MIRTNGAELAILNKQFEQFQTRIKHSKKQDCTYFISQLGKYEKKYKQQGLERSYAESIFSFAEALRRMGINDLPGIIYSNLMKMPFLNPQIKEFYAKKGLMYAQDQGDLLHILARLVDLEKIYKQTKQNHKQKMILFEEEKVLMNICSNFSNARDSYRTYSRPNSSRKKYELELAKTRVDIAKFILKTAPNQARTKLIKARRVFERESRVKEVGFVDLLLSEIKD